MSESPKGKWFWAALVSIPPCAFGAGLLVKHATLTQAIFAGILVAIISGSLVGLIVQFRRRNYRFSLGALVIVMTLVATAFGLVVYLSPRPLASPPIDRVEVPEF